MPEIVVRCVKVWFMNCVPLSVMNSVGENRHTLRYGEFAADVNLNVVVSGNGPIVSMAMRCVGFSVEITNLEARMI